MIELTRQQHDAMQQTPDEPVRAIDPATKAEYVLLPADAYERLRLLVSDDRAWGAGAFAAAVDAFARDGWDDPRMDVYDSLPPSSEPA